MLHNAFDSQFLYRAEVSLLTKKIADKTEFTIIINK